MTAVETWKARQVVSREWNRERTSWWRIVGIEEKTAALCGVDKVARIAHQGSTENPKVSQVMFTGLGVALWGSSL
jgi:hypothetical protein